MDDHLDDIDFSAIDQIVENHQAKQRGSQAAPNSPYGKGVGASNAAAPQPSRQQHAAPQQHVHQQHQQQLARQQQQQRQPQPTAAGPSRDHNRVQAQHTSAYQQLPAHQHARPAQPQQQHGQYNARQPVPTQQSVYTGPRPAAVHQSSGPVGRVSQAAAALGQQQQQRQQQHMQWQQPGAGAAAGADMQYSNREQQLHAEKEELQQLLKAEQGRNTMLKQNLERKERERDDLQRRMQQLSSQSTGTSSVTIAEAQKEIATLKQEMAFKENEIHELKRRCAEKDQSVQPLEEQVNHLQEERARIQQELEEAYRERRERGAGASTSFDPPPAAPRLNSPSPSRGRKPAFGARSSKSTTGVKRKLANVLGSPAGTPGGTPAAAPMQNGHAPLPLQSVANGQVSNREGQGVSAPPARQSGVTQNRDPASTAPAAAAPDLPAYELPSWSRFPQSSSHASATLQQLWLKCPDSFSFLLTPQRLQFPAHQQAVQDSAARRSDSHEMTQPESEALTQLTVQIQQHVQMLACGSKSASASMLYDLVTFLQTCQEHTARRHESSSPMSANERKQRVGQQVPGNDSATSRSAPDRLMAAALLVTAALIACDKACQQAITSRLAQDQVNAQVPVQNKEADVASLHLGGLQLSARLTISFGADPSLARLVLPANSSRAEASPSVGGNKQLDKLLLDVIIKQLLASAPSVVQPALSCLRAMVAVTPSDSRAAFAPLITSGVMQQLLCQPQHAQQALQLLHLLVQSISLCQVLNAGLDEGFQLGSGTATAPSPSLRPGDVQEDAAGHSASSPMGIDVDNNDIKDHPASWTGTTELLDCLVASLQIHTPHGNPPQDPPDPNLDPHPSQPTPHLPPAINPMPESAASTPPAMAHAHSFHTGVHQTQRMALLVIATLLQQLQYGLLMHLIRRGEGGKDMSLCQSLLEMVDSVTRGQPDSLLAAFIPPADPSAPPFVTPRSLTPHPTPSRTPSAAACRATDLGFKTDAQASHAVAIDQASDWNSQAHAWQENVRLSQEALTLLRVLLVDNVLGRSYKE
ncbi:TPA: hypothetical protein ACH3X1_000142 [Trebouxia sp. C0004]